MRRYRQKHNGTQKHDGFGHHQNQRPKDAPFLHVEQTQMAHCALADGEGLLRSVRYVRSLRIAPPYSNSLLASFHSGKASEAPR